MEITPTNRPDGPASSTPSVSEPSPPISHWSDSVRSIRWPDAALLGLLILLGFKAGWGTEVIRDIEIGDETIYLSRGCEGDWGPASLSPLYCGWYAALSWVVPDSVDLYFVSWRLITMLLGVGVFVFARVLGGSSLTGFLAGAVLLTSSESFNIWPRPMPFAATLLLCGFAIAFSFRCWRVRLALATLTAGVAAFARPEFALSFLILAPILLALLVRDGFRRPKTIRSGIGLATAGLLPAALLCLTFGNPLAGNRSEIAFAQHYAKGKWDAGLMEKTRSSWFNFEAIVVEDFGSLVTPLEALRANPQRFREHVERNIAIFVPNCWRFCGYAASRPVTWLMQGCLVALALVGGIHAIVTFRSRSLREIDFRATIPLLCIAATLAPIFIASMVINPRVHYLVGAFSILLAGLAGLAGIAWSRRRGARFAIAQVALAAAIALLAPNHNVVWGYRDLDRVASFHRQPMLGAVNLIRRTPLTGDLRVLGIIRQCFFYANRPATSIPIFAMQHQGFAKLLAQGNVNVVIPDPRDETIDWVRQDPDYLRFCLNPPPGWVAFEEPGVPYRLIVRRDALEESPVAALSDGPDAWTNSDWDVLVEGDFDGNGRGEILGLRDGAWHIGPADGSGSWRIITRWNALSYEPGDAIGTADFNGDGWDDVYTLSGSTWYIGLSTRYGFEDRPRIWSDGLWRDAVVGDFDGDGRDDVAARLQGAWYVGLSDPSGRAGTTNRWGNWASDADWQNLCVGDFDEDGRSDLAARIGRQWHLARSTGKSFVTAPWTGPATGPRDVAKAPSVVDGKTLAREADRRIEKPGTSRR